MKCFAWTLVVGTCLLMAPPSTPVPSCRLVDGVASLPELPEASGLAAGRRTQGVLWSHNDSGEPIVFALTATGAVSGRVRIPGARVEDWEAIAVGPCPQGTCLYIGDIGDNEAKRRSITIYRTPEPAPGATRTDNAEAMYATYPDGPQDAEGLIVVGSDLFIVTKGETGPVALYRFGSPFRSGATVTLERIAELVPAKGKGRKRSVAKDSRITDASASVDGRWVVLRTPNAVAFHDAREFTTGRIREVSRHDVSGARERQGEGVALSADGDAWIAGEGGGKARPGTLARLDCTLP